MMANPLFNQMSNNNMNGFMSQLQKLKSQGGNPQEIVQNLLNSGKVSQAQYNAAVQRMQQIQKLMGR